MRNTFLPVAAICAVLVAGFGARTAGGPAQRERVVAGSPEAAKAKTDASKSKKRPVLAKSAPCTGELCDDAVIAAARLAKQEADATLKQAICGFIAEYSVPDADLVDALGAGAPPNNTYCNLTDADKAEGMDAKNQPVVDKAVRPKVILAVLPDPVHTQLGLRFDEAADELQNSMQDLGWTFDRAWLPWDNMHHEAAEAFESRMENKVSQGKYETSPGAILFRGNADKEPRQALIVLVVADKPTGGIDAVQFRNAIKIWQRLTGWDTYIKRPANSNQPSDAGELSILGPSFSGSMPSLQGLLRELTQQAGGTAIPSPAGSAIAYFCPPRNLHISIVSGTITGTSYLQITARVGSCKTLHVDPKSMAVDLRYEYIRLLLFLHRHGSILPSDPEPVPRIAVLSEAESSFGASGSELESGLIEELSLADTLRTILQADQTAREAIKNLKDKKAVLAAQKDVISDEFRRQISDFLKNIEPDRRALDLIRTMGAKHFFFPREISKLRAAYEQNSVFGFSSQSNSVRTQLHLSLSGNATEDDTVHTFSGGQGPAAMEAALAQLAAELERQKITIAILSATDVLDEIFVTRYLNQHAPNVSVIVTDTDGLFLRGGDSSLDNAYVVGPWPLIPGNQEWSATTKKGDPGGLDSRTPPVRIHNSAAGQGLYSAVRLLVYEGDKRRATRNSGAAVSSPALVIPEYQPPVATSAATTNDLKSEPPLWLSSVGRGGFWPISLVDVDQATDGLPESAAVNLPRLVEVAQNQDGSEKVLPKLDVSGIREANPRSITILTFLIAVILLWHGAACVRARLDRGFAWSYALSDQDHLLWLVFLQTTITLAAIPALVFLKVPNEMGVVIRTLHLTSFNWFLQGIAMLLATWPALLLLRGRPWPTDSNTRRWVVLRIVLWLLLLAVYVWVVNAFAWNLIAPSPNKWPTERAFFFYRSGHLFSGSSPVLPVLLLGAALVIYLVSVFDRLVFYKNRIPILPTSDPILRCPGPDSVKVLNNLLSKAWNPGRLGLLAAVFGILLLSISGLREMIPHSLTQGRFDLVILIASGLVTLLLAHDLAVAVLAWFLLRADCLLPLKGSPLRWGFTWIKGWSWKRIWEPGAVSPNRIYDYLIRLSEANARALKIDTLAQANKELREQVKQAPKGVDWAHEVTTKLGTVHRELAGVASQRLNELQELWAQDYGPITGSETTERGLAREIPLNWEFFEKDEVKWKEAHDRMAKEEFVALLYLGYIRMVLLQIRNRIVTAAAMYVLLLWALTSYPFLNHHYVLIGLSSLMAVLAGVVIWIYSQMHRDDILSRTTETSTEKLDADFFAKILSMVGLPLLTLIASQFPEISNVVFSWLEPGLSSVK